LSVALAVDITPGTPAPGCVLAPTKYKLLYSLALFEYLKYADCLNIG